MHPLKWDSSAAGHVNSGQNYDETAPRELEEELGVKAAVTLIGSIAARQRTGWEHVRLYTAPSTKALSPWSLPRLIRVDFSLWSR